MYYNIYTVPCTWYSNDTIIYILYILSDEQLNRRHELIAGNLDRVARGQPLRSVVIAADGPPSPSK